MANNNALNILIVGTMGTGKSSFIKKLTANKSLYVFDVNNEYPDCSTEFSAKRAKMTGAQMSMKEFVENCFKRENTNCIFEEATGFFKGNVSNRLQQLMVSKRHTGNNYVFLFHSINRIPPAVFELCNVIVLFKTNDEPETVRSKYNRIFNAYLYLSNRNLPPHAHKIIDLI